MSGHADSKLAVAATVALIAASSFATRTAQASAPKLLVFLHVAVKQRALQGALQGGLPGTDVTAVGRVGDFERALMAGTDAVLASAPVLSSFKLRIRLQGSRAGSAEERYSLIGVGSEPNSEKVASVGALDLLGRDGTNAFVHGLLGTTPRVERVSKVEDLLPLLQMQRVDAILLPARLFTEIKSASKLVLVPKELQKTVGLPAVAAVSPVGDSVAASVGRMPVSLAKMLGVDSWR